MHGIEQIKQGVISRFIERCAGFGERVSLLVNPIEELDDARINRKPIKLFARGLGLAGQGQGARARLEENYLYDTRRFPIGAQIAQENLFFQNNVGGNPANNGFVGAGMSVMTELETNMTTPGQIEQGKNFVFTSVGVAFNVNASTADVSTMLEAGFLRFSKQGGQYTLKHGPISLWPAGIGVAGFASIPAAGTLVESAHNGSADVRAMRKLAIPRIIREKESFNYSYTIPRTTSNRDGVTALTTTGTLGIIMRVILWGGQEDAIPV